MKIAGRDWIGKQQQLGWIGDGQGKARDTGDEEDYKRQRTRQGTGLLSNKGKASSTWLVTHWVKAKVYEGKGVSTLR